jgi:hypothetical protein
VRAYVAVAVSARGRRGPPSPVALAPLVEAPPAPSEPVLAVTEAAVVVEWPAVEGADGYNLYSAAGAAAGAAPAPLNTEPTATARFEDPIAEFGRERCYEVRAVRKVGRFAVEGEASPRACVTPRDTFPPAAPTGLTAVAAPGAVNLIWNAGAEKDLAGYVVLRGEAPGGTLQPLVESPIAEPMYRDTTVTPGRRYLYAVVAVDRADPPNRSAPSATVEVVAR